MDAFINNFTYDTPTDDGSTIMLYWLFGLLVSGFICGLICRSITENKGYDNRGAWFACGFFLGIIGIIIAALEPNQPKTHSSTVTHIDGIRCPSCGYNNSINSTHCVSCGRRMSSLTRKGSNDNKWRCKCGALNYSYETSCHSCGTKLSDNINKGKCNTWRCPCGALNYENETSCHSCGKKIGYKPKDTKQKSEVNTSSASEQKIKSATANQSITEQLEELKKLQEQGLITQEDYDSKKKQILNL